MLPKAITLVHIWSGFYYHQIIDILPIMWKLRTFLRSWPRDIPLLLTEDTGFEILLPLLQWKLEDLGEIIWIKSYQKFFVEALYFPGEEYCGTSESWVAFRTFLFNSTIPKLTGTQPHIISRGPNVSMVLIKRLGTVRRLQGLEILEDLVRTKYGPDNVQVFNGTEGLALRMFSTATLVVAPHGAGLSNMIFAPSNLVILEIIPNKYANMCFQNLADVLGMKYHSILGNGTFSSPLSVDVN